MAGKTGGLGLVEIERLKEGDEAEIGKLTGLLELLRPYIVFSMQKTMYFLPALSCFIKGRRDRRDKKTSGEKRLV